MSIHIGTSPLTQAHLGTTPITKIAIGSEIVWTAPAVGGFDLIAAAPWQAAYWTEGPAFGALGLGNGAAVTSWPDESGNGYTLTTSSDAGGSVLFSSAEASLNNHPAVSLLESKLLSASFADRVPSDGEPAAVAVFYEGLYGSNRPVVTTNAAGGSGTSLIIMREAENNYRIRGSTNISRSPRYPSQPHVIAYTQDGSYFSVDGLVYPLGGGSGGNKTWDVFQIGQTASSGNTFNVSTPYAFVGFLKKSWVDANTATMATIVAQLLSHYGITPKGP